MSEEKPDKILIFLMLGGAMLASEGTIHSVTEYLNRDQEFFLATRPDDGVQYIINLHMALSINSVPRESVMAGPNKIVVPGSGTLH